MLITAREIVQNELSSWFGSYYEQIKIAATFNLIYNAAVMVQNQMGAALCLNLESQYENLRYIPLEPKLETGSALAWKRNQTLSPAVRAFIEHVKEK